MAEEDGSLGQGPTLTVPPRIMSKIITELKVVGWFRGTRMVDPLRKDMPRIIDLTDIAGALIAARLGKMKEEGGEDGENKLTRGIIDLFPAPAKVMEQLQVGNITFSPGDDAESNTKIMQLMDDAAEDQTNVSYLPSPCPLSCQCPAHTCECQTQGPVCNASFTGFRFIELFAGIGG